MRQTKVSEWVRRTLVKKAPTRHGSTVYARPMSASFLLEHDLHLTTNSTDSTSTSDSELSQDVD